MCDGKHTYPTKRDAKAAARHTESRGRGAKVGKLDAYRCPLCGWFHVGHRPGTWRPREGRLA